MLKCNRLIFFEKINKIKLFIIGFVFNILFLIGSVQFIKGTNK